VAVGKYWKVGEYHGQSVFLQEDRTDNRPSNVLFDEEPEWLLCALDPLPGQKKPQPKWLGRGLVPAQGLPVDLHWVKWHFPPSSVSWSRNMECIPLAWWANDWYQMARAELSLQLEGEATRHGLVSDMQEELAAKDLFIHQLRADLQHFNEEHANYQHPAEPVDLAEVRRQREANIWVNYGHDPRHKGKGKAKCFQHATAQLAKTGWFNKMIALLGAVQIGNQERIKELADKFVGCKLKLYYV
jgi:hypothetical protein